ncbi:glycosyltransferase [Foetidibacter luteolus]|uniref:glycosyltransferase n=1 Tax=Foetidibacter luteolus TaxID=2608880 RepID=UPI001A98E6BA|nr:glycosyltransferase [Foetidibacter luteolus]
MLQNRNILCISNPLWEGDYAKTIVELMSIFARQNKVLYVDNPYTIKDLADGLRGKKKLPVKRALGLQKRLRKINLANQADVYVLTPPVILTINFLSKGALYSNLLKLNGWLVTRSIRKALRQLQMNDKLVNITAFNPSLGLVTGRKFNESLLIYHCYDAIEAANWMKKHGPWQEEAFMQMADAVITTSQGLYEKKKDFSRRCFLVKNAANIGLFSAVFSAEPARQNTVGYIGSIDDRVDYELLENVISSMPGTQFVFIGRTNYKAGEQKLRQLSNVTLAGAKSLQQLPALVSQFSAGIIPFLKNEFTKGIYPLKINEYLAAGIPVVTTNFGYLAEFENIVSIAASAENFTQMLVEEIANDSPEKRAARLHFAQQNSWEQRVEEISDIITLLEQQR